MRPEWTDAEKGEAAGIAHRAAFVIVCPEPPEGWRNSYSVDDEPRLAAAHTAAHTAAHQALDEYPDGFSISSPSSPARRAAWLALTVWEEDGRPILGYEHHVPRLSEASAARPTPGDNPRQRP